MSDAPSPAPQSRFRQMVRGLRPLLWWLVLVLVLFAWRTHERLSAETRLAFKVWLQDRSVSYEAATQLDGKPFSSGERIPIGWHRFAVSHPKTEPFSAKLFIWYGERDLGDIVLTRQTGLLSVEANPAAGLLAIFGPEFSVTLTNSLGMTSSVPTDAYQVAARWANYGEKKEVSVPRSATGFLRFAPSLGTVTLESEPSGATVVGESGHELGTTPLSLGGLLAGTWKGEIRLDGYIPVPLRLAVSANQTNVIRTNMVNWQYAEAMNTARQYFASGDNDRALEALTAALKGKPNDHDATALQIEAKVARHLQRADALTQRGEYAAARQEAESALSVKPESVEAKAKIAGIERREREATAEKEKRREQELADKQRQERLDRPKVVMDSVSRPYLDADLFDSKTLASTKPAKEIGEAVHAAIGTGQPAFEITRYDWPETEVFVIEAKQKMFSGFRQCLIVGGQTGDGETRLVFKVLEYETHLNINLGGFLRVSDGKPPIIAVHPSRIADMTSLRQTRVKEGVQIVTERIQRAIGQAAGGK